MDQQDWIKELIMTINAKVDKIDQKIDVMEQRHIINTEELKNHIYRTELAEENISILREQLEPVEKHIQMLNGCFKLIGVISTFIGIGAGLIKILSFFNIS